VTASDLTAQAAARIARHVRDIRTRWPGVLGEMTRMAAMRGKPGIPDWPQRCWLPMGAVGAYLDSCESYRPDDIAIVAAIGQWRLLGRRVVVQDADVAAAAVPPRASSAAEMDLRLPQDAILDALDGACYYLVNPLPRPSGQTRWVSGCYMHLEQDTRPGWGPELRLLADTDEGLAPVPIHLDEPTLAWSVSAVAAVVAAGIPGEIADMTAQAGRLVAWMVWPLLGALVDKDGRLTRIAVLGDDTDPNVRGAQVYQISYTVPRHLSCDITRLDRDRPLGSTWRHCTERSARGLSPCSSVVPSDQPGRRGAACGPARAGRLPTRSTRIRTRSHASART
jgi:hypothetical protein